MLYDLDKQQTILTWRGFANHGFSTHKVVKSIKNEKENNNTLREIQQSLQMIKINHVYEAFN